MPTTAAKRQPPRRSGMVGDFQRLDPLMPSVLIIDHPTTSPMRRKIARWSELAARLREANVDVGFYGVQDTDRVDLQAATGLGGSARQAIDVADLVILGTDANPTVAYWAIARRGAAGLPVIATSFGNTSFITPDMWPTSHAEALQQVEANAYPAAIDRVLGTTLADRTVGILEPAALPIDLLAAPHAYPRFGTGALLDDVTVEDLRRAASDTWSHETPPGRIGSNDFPSTVRQALFIGITTGDPGSITEVLRVVHDSARPGGPINTVRGAGARPRSDWAIHHLAVFCPDELLAQIPDDILSVLWDHLSNDRVATIAAVLQRGGRLLEIARNRVPQFDAIEGARVTQAVERLQAKALDLRGGEFFSRGPAGVMGSPEKHESLNLALLGYFPVPDILQMETSIPAALANPHYLIAAGRAHGLPTLIRELTGLVQGRTWADRGVREAIYCATEFFPPRTILEMAEWDDLLRNMRSKSLRTAILKGAETWPALSGPLTDLFRQHTLGEEQMYYRDKALSALARRTLDPGMREALESEAQRLRGATGAGAVRATRRY